MKPILALILPVILSCISCKKENATIEFFYSNQTVAEAQAADSGIKDSSVFGPMPGSDFERASEGNGVPIDNIKQITPYGISLTPGPDGQPHHKADNSVFGEMEVYIDAPGLDPVKVGQSSGPYENPTHFQIEYTDITEYLKSKDYSYKLVYTTVQEYDTTRVMFITFRYEVTSY